MYEGPIAAEMVDARAQPRAAGHAVARRSGRLRADQARAGLRALSRLDRLRHAAAVVGRHRDPAGAGAARTVRASGATRPTICAPLHLIAEASRLAFADRDRYVADPAFVEVPVAGLLSPRLSRGAPQADLGGPQHGQGRSRRAAGLCRARHQPHEHRRPLGQCRRLHHHHRGAVRRPDDGARLPPEQRADRFLAACPSATASRSPTGCEPGKRPRSSMSPTFVLDRDRKLVAGAGLGRRRAHHRRHAAGADRHARLGSVGPGRPRPAAGRQPATAPTELEDRDADCPTLADALARAGP